MAELDDIQRSMEESEDVNFEEQKYRPRKPIVYEDDDKIRDPPSFVAQSRIPKQESPSESEHSSYLNSSPNVDRISSHEWTFEEQFKQVYRSQSYYIVTLTFWAKGFECFWTLIIARSNVVILNRPRFSRLSALFMKNR